MEERRGRSGIVFVIMVETEIAMASSQQEKLHAEDPSGETFWLSPFSHASFPGTGFS